MSSKSYLLDASALLAAIHNELGGDLVQEIVEESVVSSVNWSEVLQKLNRADADTQAITSALKALGLEIIAFNEDDASIAASLWPETKSLGLSLADRACLATGRRLKLTVVTADKVWQSLDAEQKIKLIR